MAPQVGLEPTTDRLTADSSTTELLWINKMERVMGIEPTTSAWKAEVLPLNYTRTLFYFNLRTTRNYPCLFLCQLVQRSPMRRGNSQHIHRCFARGRSFTTKLHPHVY